MERRAEEILRDHPKLYQNLRFLEIGDGWLDLVYELSSKIEPLLSEDMYASQVKEKFGGLRFYMSTATDEIFDIIDEYEDLSLKTCEGCGKPGKRRKADWIRTECEECYGARTAERS